jgi:purine nucleosidase
VLQAGANVTLVGMDVTMTTLLSTDMMAEISREGDDAARVLMDITRFYVDAYKAMYPGIQGCGLHDPLAVAVAVDPSLVGLERMYVDIELNGELTRGQTVADRRITAIPFHNANVAMSVDRARFEAEFMALMKAR